MNRNFHIVRGDVLTFDYQYRRQQSWSLRHCRYFCNMVTDQVILRTKGHKTHPPVSLLSFLSLQHSEIGFV